MRNLQAGHGQLRNSVRETWGELFRLLIVMTERMQKQESFRC
ncbi:hypothetical protein SS05631_c10100 [Sinorhizobium sp. CCBAU 05631]|nr:hypothetical protein SS05631_c10100 [Sinorhizobium sp. CCBAU 05631]